MAPADWHHATSWFLHVAAATLNVRLLLRPHALVIAPTLARIRQYAIGEVDLRLAFTGSRAAWVFIRVIALGQATVSGPDDLGAGVWTDFQYLVQSDFTFHGRS